MKNSKKALWSQDWAFLEIIQNVNEMSEKFVNVYMDKFDECIPMKQSKKRKFVHRPYFNDELHLLRKEKIKDYQQSIFKI